MTGGGSVHSSLLLPLIAAILIFKCTEGAGVGDYTCSSRVRGARKIVGV